MKKKKTTDERLLELEEFHDRVKLGQKWFLCGLAFVGSIIATASYFLSALHSWLSLSGK